MIEKEEVLSERRKTEKSMPEQDSFRRSSKYNYLRMEKETDWAKEGFPGRLAALRIEKGISGREMSLALGQGAGYINNIENGYNLPSMAMFFEICEYMNVSPEEFFLYTATGKGAVIAELYTELAPDEQELLLKLAKKLRRETE